MKINEFKSTINEGMADNLLGTYNIPDYFRRQPVTQASEKSVQKQFFNNFLGKAYNALTAAISSGLVDQTSTATTQTVNTIPPTATSATPSTPSTATGSMPPTVREPGRTPKPIGPTNAEQTVAAARQHRQNVDKAQAIQAAGRAAASKPGYQRTAADKLDMKAAGLSESQYVRLNALFESIMEAQSPMSIYQFMKNWYTQYMGSLDWKSHGVQIDQLLKDIQRTYNKDSGKNALIKLAQATYALASVEINNQYGTNRIYQPSEPQPTTPQKLSPEQLKTELFNLSKTNHPEYSKIKASMPNE